MKQRTDLMYEEKVTVLEYTQGQKAASLFKRIPPILPRQLAIGTHTAALVAATRELLKR